MVQNTEKQVEYTSLLKAQSVLSQAHELITQDNGGDLSGIVTDDATASVESYALASADLATLFKNQMRTTNFCDNINTPATNCYDVGMFKTLNNSTSSDGSGINPTLTTADGFVYLFQMQDSNCSNIFIYQRNGSAEGCGTVFVDVNGAKSPNTLGKDVFLFSINKYGVTPFKYPFDGENFYDCGGISAGRECAAKAVADGKIDYY